MTLTERIIFQNRHWGQSGVENFPFHRELFERIWQDVDTRLIALITGPRRTGKSVLLKQLMSALMAQKQVAATQILFFEFSPRQTPETIWDVFRYFTHQVADPRLPIYLCFDEIQYIHAYESVIKEIYDNASAAKIFLTGSLSLSYKRQMQESLSGRFFAYQLFPLHFAEYLQLALPASYADYQQAQVETNPFVRQRLLATLNADFRHFLAWGRLPEMVTFSQAQASAYLQTVLSQSLNQDAFAYFDIEKPPLIKALYEYLCLNQGGLLNLTSLAGELGASAKTVAAYMDVLELMGLTYLIYNSTHPLIKLNSSRKAYVSSMFALLNSKFDWPNALGLAAEAYVLERLLERGETVTFFRQRTQEIDFLLPKKKLAYEVKYRPDPGPIPATLPDYHIEIISLDQALPVCLF